jgi:hypothetical protein
MAARRPNLLSGTSPVEEAYSWLKRLDIDESLEQAGLMISELEESRKYQI